MDLSLSDSNYMLFAAAFYIICCYCTYAIYVLGVNNLLPPPPLIGLTIFETPLKPPDSCSPGYAPEQEAAYCCTLRNSVLRCWMIVCSCCCFSLDITRLFSKEVIFSSLRYAFFSATCKSTFSTDLSLITCWYIVVICSRLRSSF